MRRPPSGFHFRGPLGELMEQFVREKRSYGYRYEIENVALHSFDRFLVSQGLAELRLPKAMMDAWTASRPGERPTTQKWRIGVARRFALFLRREGIDAHVPDVRVAPTAHRRDFVPYIFTRAQVAALMAAVDRLPASRKSPLRPKIMPEILRLLYGCGLRISEVLNLEVGHVDLVAGILTISNTKFGKDRLVPVAPSMAERLRRYADDLGPRDDDQPFFPTRSGSHYTIYPIYTMFRQLLRTCGIPHGGKGRGPRLHDLRATFAVHRLESWYRQGEDLGAKLPVLATYLGHDDLAGTQWYLRLTPSLFPDVTEGMEASFGHVIPRGAGR